MKVLTNTMRGSSARPLQPNIKGYTPNPLERSPLQHPIRGSTENLFTAQWSHPKLESNYYIIIIIIVLYNIILLYCIILYPESFNPLKVLTRDREPLYILRVS